LNKKFFILNKANIFIKNEIKMATKVVITGSLIYPGKRDDFIKHIKKYGVEVSANVAKDTNYLITNETVLTTKYQKAHRLSIPIISELRFLLRLHNGIIK